MNLINLSVPPIVYLDADDTLFSLQERVFDIICDRWGHEVPHPDTYNFWNMASMFPGLTQEHIHEVLSTPGLFKNLDVKPGVVKAVTEMRDAGLDVRIATSPYDGNPTCLADKREQIGEVFGGHMRKTTTFLSDKTVLLGRFLVDDKPVITGAMATPVWTHIVAPHAYNLHVNAHRMDWFNWADSPIGELL